jgi:hypothetical protein
MPKIHQIDNLKKLFVEICGSQPWIKLKSCKKLSKGLQSTLIWNQAPGINSSQSPQIFPEHKGRTSGTKCSIDMSCNGPLLLIASSLFLI